MARIKEETKILKVAAIVPAYNEEKTIVNVLDALKQTSIVGQIIVVSDGSEDDTVHAVSNCYGYESDGVVIIELLQNRGKGGAVKAGLDRCTADIILVLDADLIGLTTDHIEALLEPVISGEALMSVGIFEKGRVATDLAQKMAPFLSGQRALRRNLLESISDLDFSRFGLEMALHQYVEENELAAEVVQLPDLSHVMKEEKLGFSKGVAARAKMYWEIVKYAARIDINP
jgi:glycosyltransferase involved in cell wall biosynthesis